MAATLPASPAAPARRAPAFSCMVAALEPRCREERCSPRRLRRSVRPLVGRRPAVARMTHPPTYRDRPTSRKAAPGLRDEVRRGAAGCGAPHVRVSGSVLRSPARADRGVDHPVDLEPGRSLLAAACPELRLEQLLGRPVARVTEAVPPTPGSGGGPARGDRRRGAGARPLGTPPHAFRGVGAAAELRMRLERGAPSSAATARQSADRTPRGRGCRPSSSVRRAGASPTPRS